MLDNQDCPSASAAVRQAACRVLQRCDELAGCSEEAGRLTRTFCSEAMQRAHALVRTWMHGAGMTVRLDAAGNIVGRWPSMTAHEKVFLIGSHLDTVIDAGRFDGPLGVLLGLAAVELLSEAHTKLKFAVDVVGFSEEEGVRFRTPFLGSRAIVNDFDRQLFELVDREGGTVRQALLDFGADPDALAQACYSRESLLGFLEPHIEQGKRLERWEQAAGVVSAIAGQTRATFQFTGVSGHAGTMPHSERRDALAAAAEFMTYVEQLGQQTEGLFATVGQLTVEPNLSNVVAGRVRLRLDLRHADDSVRLSAYAKLRENASECGQRRGVIAEVVDIQQQPAVVLDQHLTQQLRSACQDAGLAGHTLVSGAGHDAMVISRRAPSCMLFLRCRGGISHHPDEHTELSDVTDALDVMVRFLLRINQSAS